MAFFFLRGRLAASLFLLLHLALAFAGGAEGEVAQSRGDAIARGEQFLTNLFNPRLQLLPEYRGSHVYWLFHDNYLAAKLLDSTRADLAVAIRNALQKHGSTNSGKIEILFDEALRPLPFRSYVLTDVAQIRNETIRTEVVTDQPLKGWEEYADLLLLAAMAERQRDPVAAKAHFAAAEALWDGVGLKDRAVRAAGRYATYKLALYLIAAHKLGQPAKHHADALRRLLELQNANGGWITDYLPDGRPHGMANVETTCMALLALQAQP